MPLVKSVDLFVERSLHLLENRPSTTLISITYGSQSKKNEKSQKVTKNTASTKSEEKSFVSIKIYDPNSGELHKYKTNKSKELSKILNALGPHGVQIPKPTPKIKKIKKSSDETKDDSKPSDSNSTTSSNNHQQIRGFGSILANTEIKQDEEIDQVQSSEKQSNPTISTSSRKNKKKKGKR